MKFQKAAFVSLLIGCFKTSSALFNQVIGKNVISKVPGEMATLLGMENPEKFTFHLLRWSSATEAANQGATTAQMTFGTF